MSARVIWPSGVTISAFTGSVGRVVAVHTASPYGTLSATVAPGGMS